MGLRLKLGRHLSIGATGLRFHGNTRHIQASAGKSGFRLFARKGPFYWSK